MSRRHFSWLLFLSVVVAVAALLLPSRTGKSPAVDSASLVPGLQEQVNDVDWLRIRAAGDTVVATLARREGQWVIEEAGGYRADWARLRPLLSSLASAIIVEEKTRNPDYYDRLGVEDTANADAAGVLVEFSAQTGLPAVIIGNRAQGRTGQYARLQGAQQSVLIDSPLDLPRERGQWLDRDIVDIGEGEVVEIGITHPDGEKIVARKASADDRSFALEGIPQGHEIKSEWSVNALAGSLASLTLEAVAPDSEIDWGGATHFRLLTADGLDTGVMLVEKEGAGEAETEYWLRLSSGVYKTGVGTGVESGPDGAAGGLSSADRAAQINQRVQGWAYRVPRYKYDAMVKRMGDLVQSQEPET